MLKAKILLLIINANDWYNKGDVSNRVGMITSLQKVFHKRVNIIMESATPKLDSVYFCRYNVSVIPSIYEVDKSHNLKILTAILFIGRIILLMMLSTLVRVLGLNPPSNSKSRTVQYLNNIIKADAVISSAGGFIHDELFLTTFLPHIFLLFISSVVLNKPTILYAQSIGPFRRKLSSLVASFILNKMDLIILREALSKKIVDKLGIKTNVVVTTDATFAFPKKVKQKIVNRSKQIRIGLTVIGRWYSKKFNKSYINYLISIIKMCNFLINKYDAHIIILPQTLIERDIATARIIKRMVNSNKIYLDENDYSPEELMDVINNLDFMICSRMHSAIFSALVNVPFVAIGYQPKFYGIMSQLGMQEFLIPIDDLEYHTLVDKVRFLFHNENIIRKRFYQRIKILKKRSLMSALIVKIYIKKLLKSNHCLKVHRNGRNIYRKH